MPTQRTLALLCAIAAALATLVLAAVLTLDRPLTVTPSDVEDLEPDTPVSIEGRVSDDGVHDGGSFGILTLEDGRGGSARVFLAFSPGDLEAGDRVRIEGRVVTYQGGLEVLVERSEDVEVLGRPEGSRTDLPTLLARPARFGRAGARVEVVVVSAPVAGAGGTWAWCLLTSPEVEGGGQVTAISRLPWELADQGWEPGDELELRVVPRYDACSGLVYLEVVGTPSPS